MSVQPLDREDPLEEGMATTPVFLPGKSHGQRSLVGYSPWGHKELDTTERLHFHFIFIGISIKFRTTYKERFLEGLQSCGNAEVWEV